MHEYDTEHQPDFSEAPEGNVIGDPQPPEVVSMPVDTSDQSEPSSYPLPSLKSETYDPKKDDDDDTKPVTPLDPNIFEDEDRKEAERINWAKAAVEPSLNGDSGTPNLDQDRQRERKYLQSHEQQVLMLRSLVEDLRDIAREVDQPKEYKVKGLDYNFTITPRTDASTLNVAEFRIVTTYVDEKKVPQKIDKTVEIQWDRPIPLNVLTWGPDEIANGKETLLTSDLTLDQFLLKLAYT